MVLSRTGKDTPQVGGLIDLGLLRVGLIIR